MDHPSYPSKLDYQFHKIKNHFLILIDVLNILFLGTTSFWTNGLYSTYGPQPAQTPFWTLQYSNNISWQMANHHIRIFDAG